MGMAPLVLLAVLFIGTSSAQLWSWPDIHSSPIGCDDEVALHSSLKWGAGDV